MRSGSGAATPRTQDSSSESLSIEQLYEIMMRMPFSKPELKAFGDLRIRLSIIRWVAAITIILVLIGGATIFISRDYIKDVWVIIGPIISSAISVTVTAFFGDRQKQTRSGPG